MATEKRLIDADELIRAIYKSDDELQSSQWETDEIVDEIRRSPTVDAVEVVHGYWIDSTSVDHMGRITGHGIDCSVCDSVFKDKSRAVVQHWKERFKVCPFCGAKMDGVDEDG